MDPSYDLPPSPTLFQELSDENVRDDVLNKEEDAVIWWIVAFTCIFQTLHSLSSTAVSWLLKFLGCLLAFFGRYSEKISKISSAFPSTLYKRSQYLRKTLVVPSVCNFIVCPVCLSLFRFEDCFEQR